MSAITCDGNKIQTYTGKVFDFNDIRPESIDMVDIAHALSNVCRWGGHCSKFYSVAEHSVLCSYLAAQEFPEDKKLQFYTLMHDAGEAYIGDMPKPFKIMLSQYTDIEEKVEGAIQLAFVMDDYGDYKEQIKKYDLMLFKLERAQLFKDTHFGPELEHIEMPVENLFLMNPQEAFAAFIARAASCGEEFLD